MEAALVAARLSSGHLQLVWASSLMGRVRAAAAQCCVAAACAHVNGA